MTSQEVRQQKEIERLQKKVSALTEAYSQAVKELEELKAGMVSCKRGRPRVKDDRKARILSLYQQGKSMRQVAAAVGVSASTVHKVIGEAVARTRVIYVFMDRDEPVTLIDVSNAIQRIKILNFTDDLISRAFGIREKPTWEDYEQFLESRCMPRTRYGIREELENLGLDFYDPVLIIEKTAGRVYEDSQWLWKMDPEGIKAYDALIKRAGDKEEQKGTIRELLMEIKGAMENGRGGGPGKDNR